MTDIIKHIPKGIGVDEALNLLSCCSSELQLIWKAEKERYDNYAKDRLDFVDISCFTDYIINSCKNGQNESVLMIFFGVVEELFRNGNDYVINLIEVGLLEGIQNKASWEKDVDIEKMLYSKLGSATRKSWDDLNAFWKGH